MAKRKLKTISDPRLNNLEREWDRLSNELFQKQLGYSWASANVPTGCVLGAGVNINKPKHYTHKWHGEGKTGEAEAFEIIKPKLEALGYYASYDCGRLD